MKKAILLLAILLTSCSIEPLTKEKYTLTMDVVNVKTKRSTLTGKSPDIPNIFNVFIEGEGQSYLFPERGIGKQTFELDTQGQYDITVTNSPTKEIPVYSSEWYLLGTETANTNFGSFQVIMENPYYLIEFIDDNVYYNPQLNGNDFYINEEGNYYMFSSAVTPVISFSSVNGEYHEETMEFDVNSIIEVTVNVSDNGEITLKEDYFGNIVELEFTN